MEGSADTGQGKDSSEDSAEELYENAPCGYLSTSPEGRILKVNQTFLTWTGYSREALLGGKRFWELLTVAGRIFHETHYAPLLQMQGFVHELSLDLVCADGRPLPALINSEQKRDALGRPRSIRTTLFNMTERKRYERELLMSRRKAEQLAQAKAALLATLSHEVRNPLNAITAATRLLGMTPLSDKQSKYLRILGSASGNLLALVNDILDWSKIEAGKLSLEQREFSLRELLGDILNGQAARAEEKRLLLQMETDEQVPAVLLGDPVKLGQILTNLVSNALKFTEKGGVKVSVVLRSRDGDACDLAFQVSDTGIGIPPDRLAAIFEEYTQANYDIGMKYGGTGLGLSISRKLVALHGSKMVVESEVGRGTRFSFDLRLKSVAGGAAAGTAPSSAASPQALRGLKVLVVEDNEVNTYVLARWFEHWGVSFDAARNGHEAVERLRQGGYELVLMDLHMPVLDGYDALKVIRQLPDERLRQIPIIAISASTRAWQESNVLASGFTDFIGKPFDEGVLFRKMARCTSRETPEAPAPPPEAAPPASGAAADSLVLAPDFSFTKLRQWGAGDAQASSALARSSVQALEQARLALTAALKKGAPDEYERACEALTGTLHLLEAHGLAAALRRARALLAGNAPDSTRVQAAVFAIDWEVENLVGALVAIASEAAA
ncbi:Autoinducer 2 sensor kinase/phosphatase [Corallococcus coralloides DSM 2259]|uniref:histidine kinase n=1 Tax=Corallococcus coralloides (strain ATCC 25202 / DSM 2259 / NBRC 100086 / M2) TaxID=1144275 RepID=H8MML1_CORCM|nr:ATP-binding protein [Corallococcus coralloides]AFE09266.1 Autoinducer 2 sensor kinase/phosphatase [Corallococcus coralloides DSM 2259]